MSKLQIDTAEVFEPLLVPARYKGAIGERGSGKSLFFAGLLVKDCLREPGEFGEGMRAVCIREVQKSLKDSAKRLVEDKLATFGLGKADSFKVYREVIQTPKDGVITFQGMQDHTAESIKSLEKFKRAWREKPMHSRLGQLALSSVTEWISAMIRRRTLSSLILEKALLSSTPCDEARNCINVNSSF